MRILGGVGSSCGTIITTVCQRIGPPILWIPLPAVTNEALGGGYKPDQTGV